MQRDHHNVGTPIWIYPESGMFDSDTASPGAGAIYENGDPFVVVAGRVTVADPPNNPIHLVRVTWLDPSSGDVLRETTAAYGNPVITSTPAVGPIDDEGNADFTYVTFWGASSALLANNDACNPFSDPGCDRANLCALAFDGDSVERRLGDTHHNYGAPVLHDNGDLLIPCDDAKIYTFDNRLYSDPDYLPTRWNPEYLGPAAFSATAGVFADRTAIVWHEQGGRLCRIVDPTSGSLDINDSAGGIGYGIGGAPALDGSERLFANSDVIRTPIGAPPYYPVFARRNELDTSDPPQLEFAWLHPTTGNAVAYKPPQITIGATTYNLAERLESAPAIDIDGTVICANEGYVLALRPLRGDFDGDGCRNNLDVDAFVMAILDLPECHEWDAEYGAPFGVNLIGVGDCNNDGRFDNFDIDCFVDLVINEPTCPEGMADSCCEDPGEEQSAMADSRSKVEITKCDAGSSEGDMDHFWLIITLVRAHFGAP